MPRMNNASDNKNASPKNDPNNPIEMKEKYYCIVATKARPLDIK